MLIVKSLNVVYGMIMTALLYYNKCVKSLTKHGFKLVKEKQNTVCFHVDNCKISHEYEYANVVDKTMDWL